MKRERCPNAAMLRTVSALGWHLMSGKALQIPFLLFLGLVAVIAALHAAVARGRSSVIESSVASPVTLRQVARIPLVSERPSGGSVQKVAWSPDGRRLAMSLGWGFEVLVLDSSTWREVTRIKWQTFQPERDVAFLSNTEIVTQPTENVANSPMVLAIYNSETGHLIREIARPPQYARKLTDAVATTWDGRFIATVQGLLNPALFEVKTGRFRGPIAAPTGTSTMRIAGGPAGKLAMNVTYRGQRLASEVRDELYIVDAASNTVDRVMRGHMPGIESIAWSPNGLMIATGASMLQGAGDGKWIRDSDPIRVWDTTSGEPIGSFAGFYDPIARIAWHPSNTIIATASAKGGERERGTAIRLWSIETKSMLFEHKAPGASLINGVTFHPRTGQLLWAWDSALYVFEIVGPP